MVSAKERKAISVAEVTRHLLRHFLQKMDIMNMDLEIISVDLKVYS